MTTATNPEYTDVVQKIGQMLFQALWEEEPNLDKKVRELDKITQVASYKNAWLRVKAKIKAETLRRKASNVTA
jgi:alkylhydroperoxidase/carboxymuconolactone decarboxylase family protein YurZ